MNGIMHGIGDAIAKMVRALLVWGVVAGAAGIGWVALQSHRAPVTAEWVLIGVLALIAGLLGAMSMLAWELSHIGQISRAVRSAQSRSVDHTRVG